MDNGLVGHLLLAGLIASLPPYALAVGVAGRGRRLAAALAYPLLYCGFVYALSAGVVGHAHRLSLLTCAALVLVLPHLVLLCAFFGVGRWRRRHSVASAGAASPLAGAPVDVAPGRRRTLTRAVLMVMAVLVAVAFHAYRKHEHEARAAMDLRCQEQLYRRAVTLERRKAFAAAYRTYDYLCEVVSFKPGDGSEHPCASAGRLSSVFRRAYKSAEIALRAHRYAHGRYPSSLSPILEQIPEDTRDVVAGFDYCPKAHPRDEAATCRSGTTVFTAEPFSLSTGMYEPVVFTVKGKPTGHRSNTTGTCRLLE